jgi:hypothetical protein
MNNKRFNDYIDNMPHNEYYPVKKENIQKLKDLKRPDLEFKVIHNQMHVRKIEINRYGMPFWQQLRNLEYKLKIK